MFSILVLNVFLSCSPTTLLCHVPIKIYFKSVWTVTAPPLAIPRSLFCPLFFNQVYRKIQNSHRLGQYHPTGCRTPMAGEIKATNLTRKYKKQWTYAFPSSLPCAVPKLQTFSKVNCQASRCFKTQLTNMQRASDCGVPSRISPSHLSPQGSGTYVQEEAERLWESEMVEHSKKSVFQIQQCPYTYEFTVFEGTEKTYLHTFKATSQHGEGKWAKVPPLSKDLFATDSCSRMGNPIWPMGQGCWAHRRP